MLIQFRVENYKSFDTEQKLTMIAGSSRNNNDHVYDIKGYNVLKTAAIFGSNASGKSNLIKAMAAVRNLLGFNIRIPPTDYCRIKPSNEKKGTAFEFVFSIKDEKYIYGIEILLSSGFIQSEWLKCAKTGRTVTIFSRAKSKLLMISSFLVLPVFSHTSSNLLISSLGIRKETTEVSPVYFFIDTFNFLSTKLSSCLLLYTFVNIFTTKSFMYVRLRLVYHITCNKYYFFK